MSIKRNLSALFYRERCERDILIPMLEKLTEQEAQAVWRLLQSKDQEVSRAKQKISRGY
jgi:hypothetical protein